MAGSFKGDVLPLFTQPSLKHMNRLGVHLDDYAYMSDAAGDSTYPDHANARHVYARLDGSEQPQMPPRGPFWTDAMLKTLSDWMNVAPAFEP
ncbi:MAG: hypothetical protein M3Q69_01070 [Acidobacteriota bacterium]|nr:hypothetical protein [Acidobacteriota bacterium]